MSEGSGKNPFYYRPGYHPMGDEMFGVGALCSKLDSEHLPVRSEHLDALRVVADPVSVLYGNLRRLASAEDAGLLLHVSPAVMVFLPAAGGVDQI